MNQYNLSDSISETTLIDEWVPEIRTFDLHVLLPLVKAFKLNFNLDKYQKLNYKMRRCKGGNLNNTPHANFKLSTEKRNDMQDFYYTARVQTMTQRTIEPKCLHSAWCHNFTWQYFSRKIPIVFMDKFYYIADKYKSNYSIDYLYHIDVTVSK